MVHARPTQRKFRTPLLQCQKCNHRFRQATDNPPRIAATPCPLCGFPWCERAYTRIFPYAPRRAERLAVSHRPKNRYLYVPTPNRAKSAAFLSAVWHPAHAQATARITARYALQLAELRDRLTGERWVLSVMRQHRDLHPLDIERRLALIERLERELTDLQAERKAAIAGERRRILDAHKLGT